MKKLINTIAVVLALATVASCSMFKLDNYDGPNAKVSGRLVDSQTGELIGVEAAFSQEIDWANVDWSTWTFPTITVSKGSLIVNELGWKDKSGKEVYEDQRWFVRFDGRYRNDLIFAGDYKVLFKELPCYENDQVLSLKQGENKGQDLKTLPFCRIVEPKIVYDAAAKKVRATFKVELGDPSKANSVMNVRLCANTQLFVGATVFNLAANDAGAKKEGFSWGDMVFPAVQPGEEVTLEINVEDPMNADLFKYNQIRYFRIAAMASGNGYNTQQAYNFSPIFKASADMSSIQEYTWGEL
ncbi:MAG: DUF3823 domain-containing protein [Bacteroidales bacterium]|nr:DUF3823 domain-containing protein [Bacteroidales bacterium]